MNNMNKKNLSLLIILSLVVGFAAGSFINYGRKSEVVQQQKTVSTGFSASLMIDYGNGTLKTFERSLSPNETMLQLLTDAAKESGIGLETKNYGSLGVLVVQIGQMKNGDGEKYWQYWVNNIAPPLGADKYIVQPGDVIEWKFIKSQE